jgi:hypothetical protein
VQGRDPRLRRALPEAGAEAGREGVDASRTGTDR